MSERPAITPDLKVGELLDAYPELEKILIEAAPAFVKLRNPVLRKTIARITSLRQAAQVGGVSLGDLIGRLRREAGDTTEWSEDMSDADKTRNLPADFEESLIAETLDAIAMIEGGGHPLPQVMGALDKLPVGRYYALIAPFEPAPLIDKARQAGFEAHVEKQGEARFRVIFWRT
ncbi:MAG: DUF1858 domain-containing protein [bacterium]|nr:DUF1858 domain-containing protein [bacterium]